MSIHAERPSCDPLADLAPLRRAILLAAAAPGVTAFDVARRFGWPREFVHRELTAALRDLRSRPASG